jgi:deoxyribose-phosphate aldolase
MSLEATLDEDPTQIASILDHTNVDPAATAAEIRTLCREVREHGFCSAVVVPYHAPLAHECLDGAANVVAVVGFPYGIQNAPAKRAEVEALTPRRSPTPPGSLNRAVPTT